MAFGAADLVKLYSAFLPAVTTNVVSRTTIDTAMWAMPAPGWMTGTLPGGVAWVGHNGGLANMQSFAFARTDGVVFAVAFNKGADEFEPPPLWHGLADSVRGWPAVDLFPSVDIPAFR